MDQNASTQSIEYTLRGLSAGGNIRNVQSFNNNTIGPIIHHHHPRPPTPTPSTVKFTSMPSSSAHFVGREEHIHDLKSYFDKRDVANPTRRTCVLHGIGGAGKTQISLRFIEQYDDLFSQIFWVDATTTETIKASLSAIASKPAAKEAGIERNDESVLEWLSTLREEWLLVFDGADHDPDFIGNFLPAKNRGNILVSTRNPNMHTIAGKAIEIDDMSPTEAIELLLKSALPSETSYTPEMIAYATAIVEELCYLALAIDQAGATIASHYTSLPEYLSLFKKHRLELLGNSSFRGQSKYGRTLYTTWNISLNAILSKIPTLRAASIAIFLLRMFSFMHYEGISEEFFRKAAESKKRRRDLSSTPTNLHPLLFDILVLDNSDRWNPLVFKDAIQLLMDHSFIKPTITASVYNMHRLVHTWVRDQMPEAEQISGIGNVRAIFDWSIPCQGDMSNDLPFCRAIYPHTVIHSGFVQDQFPDMKETDYLLLGRLGDLCKEMGHYKSAMNYFRLALQIQKDLCSSESDILYTTSRIATTHWHLGEYHTAKKLEEEVLERLKMVLGPEHVDTLAVMANLAATFHYLGEYQRAKEMGEQVLESRKRVLGPEHVATLQAKANLARTFAQLGEYQTAKEMGEHVLESRKRLLGPEHIDTLQAMTNLAATYRNLGEYQRAKEIEEQVLESQKRVLGPEHVGTLLAMGNLALTLHYLGEYQRAKEMEEQVLESRKRVLGPKHVDTLLAMTNLAATYRGLGEYQRAKEMEEQVLEAQITVLGPDHVHTLFAMLNLAATFHRLGEYARAKEMGEQVLEDRKRILGPEHVDTLVAMANLATTFHDLGEYERAKGMGEQVLESLIRVLGPEHVNTLSAMANLADTCRNLGEYQRAKDMEEHVLEARIKVLGPEHFETLVVMGNVAATCRNLGEYQRAREIEEQVLDSHKKVLGPEHPDTLLAMFNIAETHSDLGNHVEAVRLLRIVVKKERKILGPDHPRTIYHLDRLPVIEGRLRVAQTCIPDTRQNSETSSESLSIRKRVKSDENHGRRQARSKRAKHF